MTSGSTDLSQLPLMILSVHSFKATHSDFWKKQQVERRKIWKMFTAPKESKHFLKEVFSSSWIVLFPLNNWKLVYGRRIGKNHLVRAFHKLTSGILMFASICDSFIINCRTGSWFITFKEIFASLVHFLQVFHCFHFHEGVNSKVGTEPLLKKIRNNKVNLYTYCIAFDQKEALVERTKRRVNEHEAEGEQEEAG